MTTIKRINPEGMQYEGMSQAVQGQGRVLVSVQVGIDASGNVATDAATQARQAFDNIEKVLGVAGCSLGDVVKLTCYLTDKAAYTAYAEARNALFVDNPPASTVVIVKELLMPELLLEVEAEAWEGQVLGSV